MVDGDVLKNIMNQGSQIVEISVSTFSLIIGIAFVCGAFITDAFYSLIKFLYQRHQLKVFGRIKHYPEDMQKLILYKEYRRLKNIENKYFDLILEFDKIKVGESNE